MEKHTTWTSKEEEKLVQLLKQYPDQTYQFIASKLTEKYNTLFTSEAVRKKVRRTQKNKIGYLDRKNETDTVQDYLNLLIKSQEELQRFDDRQTSITLDIDDDKPIGICFTGDWHVGGLYTDHKQMLKDFAMMRNTDGLYNVSMGDYADNYTQSAHKGGMYEQVANPDKQKEVILHLFSEYLGEKNIVVIKGNHDNWTYKETGEDFVKHIARTIDSPYLWYGGEINIRLGDQYYKIRAHHTWQGTSALNTTNSQRRLFDASHADVIALGHLHWNETHAKSVGGKDTVWMRTGSYKITDDYTQWIAGAKSDTRVPMVILFPDKKKILDFRDMYDGIKYLNMLRQSVAVG